MSYFEDYVEDGLCCQYCGQIIDGEEPGYPRSCEFCRGQSKIERNKQRVKYAIEQFKKHNITFILKNEKIGHFHVRRKRDNQLFQFWAGTGKIVGEIDSSADIRGIHNLIKILEEGMEN